MSVDSLYKVISLESESVKWFSIPADESRFSVSFSDESVRCVCGFICRSRRCCIGLGGPHVYVCGLWCNLKAAESHSMPVQRGQPSSK